MKVNRTVLIIGVALLVIGVGAYFFTHTDSNQPVHSAPPSEQTNGRSITAEGTYTCLPHKDTTGPQTMECALGLQTAEGNYYGLTDTTADYSLIGGIPTGAEIRVSGTLTTETASKYNSLGTIAVTSLERL